MYRRWTRLAAAFSAVLFSGADVAWSQDDRVKVTTTGQAPAELPNAREAAVEDALRRAVESGGGVELWGETEAREFRIIRDVIYTKTAGLVEKYDVVRENPNQDGLYTVRIEAIVSRGSLDTKIAAWKALIRRKGHPRLMVVGSVDRLPFERRLTAELQGTLDRRGITVIDLDMLTENQRRDAERAARGDLDPKTAALIAREVGADYLVIASVEGTKYPCGVIYGLDVCEVTATAILKVVAADVATVVASEVDTVKKSSQTTEDAMRGATTTATQNTLARALGRIGEHWLKDVDQRGGAQITVVLRAISFERLNRLVQGLRSAGGIKDVIVDDTDPEGRSQFRVITNETAANIAAVLEQIDPNLSVVASSKYRIEVEAVLGDSISYRTWGGLTRGVIAVVVSAGVVLLVVLLIRRLSHRR